MLALKDLYQPSRFVTKNFYGRKYNQGLFNSLTALLWGSSKPKRRK